MYLRCRLSSDGFLSGGAGLSDSYGGLPDMDPGMHVPRAWQMPQAGPSDMGYGQDQQRMLLARTGSNPILSFAHVPSQLLTSVVFAQSKNAVSIPMVCVLNNAPCMSCKVISIKQGTGAAGGAAAGGYGLGLNLQEHQTQQGMLCNDMSLLGMGQQPGHAQMPYGHAGLAPRLENLGLHESFMDNLRGSHWQVEGLHLL